MAYMCMECYEIYDGQMQMCPKANCAGEIVEIDELMIPTIKMLNEKGYMTEFCCSGHTYDNGCNTYVCLSSLMSEVLDNEDYGKIKQMLPSSWEMEIDNYGRINFNHMIKKDFKHRFYVETYEDILDANLDFLHFVQQLPELEY